MVMKLRVLAATALIGPLAFGMTAVGQTAEDDWEFAHDPEKKLSVAMVRYEEGTALMAQCQAGALRLALTGLPGTSDPSRTLTVARSDGAADVQTYDVVAQNLLSKTWARDARFLRTTGSVQVRTTSGASQPFSASFELPAQHRNLDQVLTACGYSLENDRDQLPRADEAMRLTPPPRKLTTGGRSGSSVEISCIVQSGRLEGCRSDHHPEDFQPRSAQREAATWNGRRVHRDDAAGNEGKVFYINSPLLTVVYTTEPLS